MLGNSHLDFHRFHGRSLHPTGLYSDLKTVPRLVRSNAESNKAFLKWQAAGPSALPLSTISLASTGTEATERACRLADCYRAGAPHRVDQGMVALGIDSCAAHREMHLPPYDGTPECKRFFLEPPMKVSSLIRLSYPRDIMRHNVQSLYPAFSSIFAF